MPVLTGLAVVGIVIEGVDYDFTCEEFSLEVENQTEDGSGVNIRWEEAVAVKSRWSGNGEFKANDLAASLLVKAASSDILCTFFLDTGLETVTGDVLLTNVGRRLQNAGIQRVPVSLQGASAPVITPT